MRENHHRSANYSLLAGSYSFWEYLVFGKQLQRCRLAQWEALKNARRVLIFGDGNGRFSTHLLKQLPSIRICSLDASSAMLEKAKQRRAANGINEKRVETIQENILHWTGERESYDAVVAQFFFDSFSEEEIITLSKTIKQVLKPGGKCLVSEFHIPNDTRMAKWRAQLTVRFLYRVFHLLTGLRNQHLAAHTPLLKKEGFTLESAIYFSQKSLVSQVFQKTRL